MIPAIGRDGPITSLLQGEISAGTGEEPSLTYRLDLDRKRISGSIDGLEAVQQAAVKILQTDRYEQLIYSFNYGTEWRLVLGQDRLLVRSEIRRVLTEALLQDDRITGIEDMEVLFSGDNLTVEFTVVSQYGDFQMRKEMNGNV
ncbi:DUF2634 domain-containing protein [Paenibacillus wynnii]|uniref:DUF2634 domain-containing protein n=1 Tax=Paenibacillus wynnii TaxID=268407 RepID=UPI0027900A61|nr:DUF2634 domain-containing protein [Paenibacillus wynnii]MDQ0195804.1 hypothetical protein [Paenibacillus wynnii]